MADDGAILFARRCLVAEKFGHGIFGAGRMAFLAGAVALAFGVADRAEHGFSGFVGCFRQAFGIAALTGAIARPIMKSKGLAVFSLNEFGAFAGRRIAFCVPIRIRAVFGMAFSADTATMGVVDVPRLVPPIRFGTTRHDWGRDGRS